MLYDSLHQKLLRLPDATLVYPAHGAGSMCGKSLGSETFTTIGAQRAANHALQPKPRAQFVAELTAGQTSPPAYFAWDADLNRRRRETLELALERELAPLSLGLALEQRARGAVLLDVRDPDDYAPRHLRGSLNIGLGGRFAEWCGTLLGPEQSLVLVAVPGREREAALRLGRIGFDRVVGYLDGGPAAFDQAALSKGPGGPEGELAGHPRIAVPDLAAQLEEPRPPRVVDVRLPSEWAAGPHPGQHQPAAPDPRGGSRRAAPGRAARDPVPIRLPLVDCGEPAGTTRVQPATRPPRRLACLAEGASGLPRLGPPGCFPVPWVPDGAFRR